MADTKSYRYKKILITKRLFSLQELAYSLVNFKQHPYLVRLKQESEELNELLSLTSEEILIRWFNYLLNESKASGKISNFSSDLMVNELHI
jgi:hypothetical protein